MAERKRVIEGEEYTASSVVEKYGRIVYYHARRLKGEYELEDMVSEGFYALVRAFEIYESANEISWETYIHSSIKFHLLKVHNKTPNGTYVPRDTLHLARNIKRSDLSDKPVKEIAEQMNKPIAHVERALLYMKQRFVSFDNPLEAEGDNHELLGGKGQDLTVLLVREFAATLTPREQIVLKGMYQEDSQIEISRRIGVSQMHVSRIRKVIKQKYESYASGQKHKWKGFSR